MYFPLSAFFISLLLGVRFGLCIVNIDRSWRIGLPFVGTSYRLLTLQSGALITVADGATLCDRKDCAQRSPGYGSHQNRLCASLFSAYLKFSWKDL